MFFFLIHNNTHLVKEVIVPLNDLILNVKNSVKHSSNKTEIYEKLIEIMLKDIETKDKGVIQDFKLACQQLALFWETLE